MSFQFIPNLILILGLTGILVMFLRKLPEVVEEAPQLRIPGDQVNKKELLKSISLSLLDSLKQLLLLLGRKIWNFMLEAKDLKQGQILASKFARIITSKGRVINIGVHSSLRKAERQIAESDFSGAEETYFQILSKHPHEYAAYEGLVRIYLKQKKHSEVAETLEYLIKHNPNNDQYLAQFGNILFTTKRFREAISAYEKAIALNPLVPARFVNIGLCHEALDELVEARRYLERALDLDPANVQYLMMLVDILMDLGDHNLAIKRLKQGLEMHPEDKALKKKIVSLESQMTR